MSHIAFILIFLSWSWIIHYANGGPYSERITTSNEQDFKLYEYDYIHSSDGDTIFSFQGDGNLVLYYTYGEPTQEVLWAAGSNAAVGGYAALQWDRNLAVYDTNNQQIWSAGIQPTAVGPTKLEVTDRCVFILDLDTGDRLWYQGSGCEAPRFIIGANPTDFAGALSYCQSQGSELASIHTETEYNAAKQLCMEIDIGYPDDFGCWIGLSIDGNYQMTWSDDSDRDYGFNPDGSPTTGVIPWGSGQPQWLPNWCFFISSYKGVDYVYEGYGCTRPSMYPLCRD